MTSKKSIGELKALRASCLRHSLMPLWIAEPYNHVGLPLYRPATHLHGLCSMPTLQNKCNTKIKKAKAPSFIALLVPFTERLDITMTIGEFKKNVTVLDKDSANILRCSYINTFIDINKPYYKETIQVLRKYSDGYCYTGYLWDCLISPVIITFDYLKKLTISADVYVFWDIHTKDRIFVDNYWKFKKNDVIKLNYNVLLDNLKYLPEDIYIFNNTLKWTLILTHETDLNNIDICIKSGNI